MKIKNWIPVLALLFVAVVSSCLSNSDPTETYVDWKAKNEAYFASMKDSSDYRPDTIPLNRGGGVYYSKIITPGTGVSPLYTDTVFVHYQGRLIDWTLFDGTFKGATPIWQNNEDSTHFKINSVVRGWTEALTHMKVGERRRIVLPWSLGYGANGSGQILPYSTLIFDVRLISVGTPKSN